MDLTFKNCDGNPNAYFAVFPNFGNSEGIRKDTGRPGGLLGKNASDQSFARLKC